MTSSKLKFDSRPDLQGGRLVLSFTGWMDGGDVSSGTVQGLVDELLAVQVAEIDSEGFYIFNFPGDMQSSALFRPHIKIEEGIVKRFEIPSNLFFASESHKLAFFLGKEPNLRWREFGQYIFDFAEELGLSSIVFVGSFAGSVPHTREPRLHVSVSMPHLRDKLQKLGLRPTNYEGPGSFMTYLTTQATQRGLEMANIAAEIPAYVNGTNPSSIEAVTRRLAAILELEVDLSRLRSESNQWESRVSEIVEDDSDLKQQVRELEEQYDDELIGSGQQGTDGGLGLFDIDNTANTDPDKD